MKRLLGYEKFRFLLVGVFNTTLDFLLFNFFALVLGLNAIVGNVFSVSICIFVSYFLNHHFVFKHEQKVNAKSLAMFVVVTGISSIGIQSLIIWLVGLVTDSSLGRSLVVVGDLRNNHALEINVAKAAAVAFGMVWNFLLYKYVVFKKPNAGIEPDNIIL